MTFSNMKSIRERKNDIYIDDIKIDTVNKIKNVGLILNNTGVLTLNIYVVKYLRILALWKR